MRVANIALSSEGGGVEMRIGRSTLSLSLTHTHTNLNTHKVTHSFFLFPLIQTTLEMYVPQIEGKIIESSAIQF